MHDIPADARALFERATILLAPEQVTALRQAVRDHLADFRETAGRNELLPLDIAEELCTIYRTQFPVLREYEQNTWHDQNGRIVFTTNRGLPGVGHDRKTFEAWQAALETGTAPPEEADTERYTPPFETRDRETDMRHAYASLVALQRQAEAP